MERKYIPNILTLCRILLIWPFLYAFHVNAYVMAFYIYILASLSDALDGWLARAFSWQSHLGSFIDPLADKLLVVSSFIALAIVQSLPWWLVILVLMRDITIATGIAAWYWFIQRHPDFKPTLLSKLNTVLQLALVTVCLCKLAYAFLPDILKNVLMIVTALTTSLSYIDYVWTWGKKAHDELRKNP